MSYSKNVVNLMARREWNMLSSSPRQKTPRHATTFASHDRPPTFVYEPLQSERYISLLRVLAPSNSPIEQASGSKRRFSDAEHYELVEVTLSACRTLYQAVSYAWGDPNRSHSMNLNGQQSLAITETLATALSRLTRMCSTGYLWIDQICTDQSNNQERSQQVSFLGDIYGTATEVLIWMGDELNGLSEMKAQLARPDDFEMSHIETLNQFLCRPWFGRGWTIQEAVLAEAAILIAGASSLSLEDVEGALAKKNNWYSREQLKRSRIGRQVFEIILALRQKGPAKSFDSGFDGLLNSLGDTQTSHSRDHVYAFLGLNEDARIIINPDYNASVCEKFTNLTRAVIQGSGSLDCFRFLPRSRRCQNCVLLSWGPRLVYKQS